MAADAQEFVSLWPEKHMPNSKGLKLADSIANERIYQVGTPGFYTFFPSKEENNGAAVLICPGGGYQRLAYVISGFQLARWFNTLGVNAFVLNYRLPVSPDLIEPAKGPVTDAQRAMKMIRSRAAEWKIDRNKIGVMGSSAGGHLAASLSCLDTNFSAIGDSLDSVRYKPDFAILVSPVIDMSTVIAHRGSVNSLLGSSPTAAETRQFSMQLQVKNSTPPTFIVDAINDQTVDPLNSLLYYKALLGHQVSVSFHAFPQGAHAIAVSNNKGSTGLWTQLCAAWLNEIGMTP